jgi:hypothetical protein
MSTVVRTERFEHFIEWGVQLPTVIGEVNKAIAAAYAEAESLGLDVRTDDCFMVDHNDEHLIVRLRVLK